MFSKSLVACLSLPLLLAPYVAYADVVSLYIPDTPGLAVSADVLGVEGSTTTWRLSPGRPSGTLTDPIFAVATMVQSPDSVHLFEDINGAHAQADCGIKDGVAVCTVVASAPGTSASVVTTETVSERAFAVQVTGSPKNGAGRTAGSGLGVAGVVMGTVLYGLMF